MIKSDFLVIGSGIAGLNFAINAAKYGDVAVVTKKEIMESNTNYAQGGIAAVIDKTDNFKLHINDTLDTGCGLCDKKAVEVMVKSAPAEINKLLDLGVGFNREKGRLALTKEGGHSKRRIIHAGDMTGREIEHALIFHARNNNSIKIFEEHIAIDLIMDNGSCIGIQALDIKLNKIENFFGKAIIIATGGLGQVYKYTSNPRIATGDGIGIAYRAGASVSDIEFVQFHPTTLNKKNCPHFLISETVRGEGARLLNYKHKKFVDELLPRDIVARAIVKELKKGPVYLDIRDKGYNFIRNRFPTIYEKCYWYNVDMAKDLIPVSPAAHYASGGIKTNLDGETNIKGLFAFGEVACTGVHGANRLASNSLLESLVFSSKALNSAVSYVKMNKLRVKNVKKPKVIGPIKKENVLRIKLKTLMWKYVGIIRNKKGLKKALRRLEKIEQETEEMMKKGINNDLLELNNMVLAGKLITIAALKREESRGGHYREDFPSKDKRFERRFSLSKA